MLVFGLAVRLLTANFIAAHFNDSAWFQYGSYAVFDRQAQAVLDGKQSSFRISDSSRTDLIQYPPGYPFWMALAYRISGSRTPLVIQHIQLVLDTLAIFIVVGIVYVGFWLVLALLFSLLLQRTVTAALASLALWLFLAVFAPLIAQIVAVSIVPDPSTPEELARQTDIAALISRVSPTTLYQETVQVVLNPAARILGAALAEQTQGILLTPLALSQSLLIILPQFTTLIALVAVCFGLCYIKFMRAEIRA